MAACAIRGLSLCSGIGGLDLAIERAFRGYRTVCYVEGEAFAAATLVAQMEAGNLAEAPVWSDLRTFDPRPWRGNVDLVSAGFPCQPFSSASRGRRVAVDLWPECLRVIKGLRPAVVVLENVSKHPIFTAARNLAASGYTVTFDPFEAAELGAGYRRRRWYLVAHADGSGELRLAEHVEVAQSSRPARTSKWADGPGCVLGMDDGLPNRMDRLAALGNAVCPQQGEYAIRVLWSSLMNQLLREAGQ